MCSCTSREEFDVKHRHWGTIILTKAEWVYPWACMYQLFIRNLNCVLGTCDYIKLTTNCIDPSFKYCACTCLFTVICHTMSDAILLLTSSAPLLYMYLLQYLVHFADPGQNLAFQSAMVSLKNLDSTCALWLWGLWPLPWKKQQTSLESWCLLNQSEQARYMYMFINDWHFRNYITSTSYLFVAKLRVWRPAVYIMRSEEL